MLVIFIDMINTDFLNIYEYKNPDTDFDIFLKKFGGTTYTNIFTPAPDTARSLSAFWTGIPPYNNGCDRRGKYPHFFLNKGSFVDKLISKKVKITLLSDQKNIFPPKLSDDFFYVQSLNEINHHNNHFVFINLQDSHNVLDDVGYTLKGVQKANRQIVKSLDYIFNSISRNDFDKIIFFSDHGHSLVSKGVSILNSDSWLSNGRSKIFLHMWSKNELEHNLDSNFGSIMDLGSYIQETFNIDEEVHPKTFIGFTPNSDQLLLIEDFFTLKKEVFSNPNIWRIISNKFDYSFHVGQYSHTFDLFKEINLKVDLTKKFPHVKELVDLNMKWFFFREYERERDSKSNLKMFWFYFDNTPRYGSLIRRIGHLLLPKKILNHKYTKNLYILLKKLMP